MPRAGVILAIFAAAILVFAMASPSQARKRPTIDAGVSSCLAFDDTWSGDDGTISFCCYDDGCWICAPAYADCVWDPKGLKKQQQRMRAPADSNTGATLPPTKPAHPKPPEKIQNTQ